MNACHAIPAERTKFDEGPCVSHWQDLKLGRRASSLTLCGVYDCGACVRDWMTLARLIYPLSQIFIKRGTAKVVCTIARFRVERRTKLTKLL